MTAPVAFKTVKIHVNGVALEILRISLPDASPALAPIVFLHEGLGSVAMWRDFPAQLCAATGREGILYSRRGYGQSDAVPDVRGKGRLKPDYMHHEAYEVLPELLRQLGIQRPVLLGHSDGGTIALLHASRFDVASCIVMAPHLFVEDISIAAITQAREAYLQGDLRERLSKYHADVDGAFWQWNDIWLSPEFHGFNIEAECKKITCPLLAIQGHDDPYGTMAQIDTLDLSFLSQIGLQPNEYMRRMLLKLEQCGHSPHKDQSQQVLSSVRDWLARDSL
jgi:pimeloyl-ACP methyl ester carboxylesterase